MFLPMTRLLAGRVRKMRLFLTDTGYNKALENQEKGHIKIRNHAKVLSGDLHYDHKDRER